MIELRRPRGRFARVGHRGASALAPDNTLEALRLAADLGCDMVEFDVGGLRDGTPVLVHSNPFGWASRGGIARGRVHRRSIAEVERAAPAVPTLDTALEFFAGDLQHIGLQLDLKTTGIERGVVQALRRHGLVERTWVSSFHGVSLLRIAEAEPGLPRAYTLPGGRLGISRRGPLAPVLRGGRAAIGASLRRRLPALLARVGAAAATLHYSAASADTIAGAHDAGAAVYVWTVDDAPLAQRLVDWEADGIITNDPRIFTRLKT